MYVLRQLLLGKYRGDVGRRGGFGVFLCAYVYYACIVAGQKRLDGYSWRALGTSFCFLSFPYAALAGGCKEFCSESRLIKKVLGQGGIVWNTVYDIGLDWWW